MRDDPQVLTRDGVGSSCMGSRLLARMEAALCAGKGVSILHGMDVRLVARSFSVISAHPAQDRAPDPDA